MTSLKKQELFQEHTRCVGSVLWNGWLRLLGVLGLLLAVLAPAANAQSITDPWERVGGVPSLVVGRADYTSLAFGPDGKPYVAYQDNSNGNKARVMRLNSAGTSWEAVGGAGFSAGWVRYTSLAFGLDGKPYVAYMDEANGYKASVMRLNSAGTAWEAVGSAGFSAGVAEYTSLAFGPDGKPYVAYRDGANGGKVSVMRLNSPGTAWEVVGGAGFSAGEVLSTSLSFGPDGKPYVAYRDESNGNKASVMRLNSAGMAWEAVGGAGFSAGWADNPSLSFGPDGKPYVAYRDGANGLKASVMRVNSAGTAWELVGGAGFSADGAYFTSLTFGPNGTPHVAFRDAANDHKASVMRLNSAGTAWEAVGGAGFSAGVVFDTSLAFGPDGKPYVAYRDEANDNKARVMRLNSAGTAWEAVGGAGFLAGIAQYTSLSFGPDGKPYVAYQDGAYGNKASVMRLNSLGTAWEAVGGAGFSAGEAHHTSLSFGPDGKPYVAYRDGANGNKASVMRLNIAGTAWEAVGGAGFSAGAANQTSLTFGPDGKPYVAHTDGANGLKASVMRLNSLGTAWEAVGGAGFSADWALYISLSFGPDGKPYVAYQDRANGYKASVMRLNSAGTAWEGVGGVGFSAGVALYTSLSFGPDGKPYVAYRDSANGNKASVMRLNSVGTAWEAVGGAGFSAGGAEYTSLSFGPDGKPYVAYRDSTNGDKTSVMRLSSAGTAWEAIGEAGFSAGGAEDTSLAFGPDGKPYVAYQDFENGRVAAVMRWTGTIAVPQSISFPAQTVASRALVAGSTFELDPVALASSGLPVSYESSTPAVCTVSATTVSMVGLGACTVLARQAGDAAWQPAPDVSQSISLSANTSWSGTMPGVPGNVQVAITGGSASCTIDPTQTGFGAATGQMLTGLQAQYPGATLPNGVFSFRASGCAGDTLTVTITYPEAVSAQNLLLKWGPAASGQASSWFNPGVLVSGGRTVVSYTVTDDGAGDSETTQPGVIADPFAVVQLAASASVLAPIPVPTLHQWVLLLMAAAAALMGARVLRRTA
ncbi:choice-of-anchor U domain-containing protein [Ottowia thiooxydans]|uniref:choice-of-anchor U domain-containing protein n=1 Tax=Ottowia thiooxydans TaxID=219182 RepID=UPI00048C17C0|nr:choice-of-anchor U domain-containing protein [Ottowia thiooxydans]